MIQSPICHLEVGTLPEWRQAPSLLSPQFLLRSTLREACASQVAVPSIAKSCRGLRTRRSRRNSVLPCVRVALRAAFLFDFLHNRNIIGDSSLLPIHLVI